MTIKRIENRRPPSASVVQNFVTAHKVLGKNKKRRAIPDWSRISPQSTFAWKAPTLEECIVIFWSIIRRELSKSPQPNYRRTVDAAIREVFGIHPADLRRANRALPIVIPRQIAMCALFKLGYNRTFIGKLYERDKTCVDVAIRKLFELIDGLPNVEKAPDLIGPAPLAEQARPLPLIIPS